MRRYEAGLSGVADAPEVAIEALDLDPPWAELLSVAVGRAPLRPVQVAALRDAALSELSYQVWTCVFLAESVRDKLDL